MALGCPFFKYALSLTTWETLPKKPKETKEFIVCWKTNDFEHDIAFWCTSWFGLLNYTNYTEVAVRFHDNTAMDFNSTIEIFSSLLSVLSLHSSFNMVYKTLSDPVKQQKSTAWTNAQMHKAIYCVYWQQEFEPKNHCKSYQEVADDFDVSKSTLPPETYYHTSPWWNLNTASQNKLIIVILMATKNIQNWNQNLAMIIWLRWKTKTYWDFVWGWKYNCGVRISLR